MIQSQFTLTSSKRLGQSVWELRLRGNTSAITAPGQFVNLLLPERFLRRPISVCDWGAEELVLLVKEAGAGTRELVRLPAGTQLDVLSGLGNGFDCRPETVGRRPVLVGGGIGAAPLYGLARRMTEAGQTPAVVLGFRSKEESVYVDRFLGLPLSAYVVTEDGSLGARGFVTDLLSHMPGGFTHVLACGPTPMLRAVWAMPELPDGQYSFEARMACGFGACVGCTIQTALGPKRVCRDGPVFRKEEILWQTSQ